jgi:hypothetical protein
VTPEAWPQRAWPEAVPLFETPRNYDRETVGPEVCDTLRKLGYEPMPWQVRMWDTMYELDPDDGSLWYRERRVTVPRQSAKTTSTLAEHFHRIDRSEALGWGERPVILFTMQNASEARTKIVEDWMPIVESSSWALGLINKFNRSNGREGFSFLNGGRIRTYPPNLKGGHGGTIDEVDIDEAFSFVDNRAEQGARPAMITRPSPVISIKSTAGTELGSEYLLGKVKDGRKRVESGDDGHIYYLEYAIDPSRDDIDNPEHWHRWMPALGYTQTIKALLMEKEAMDADEFFRAFGNGWSKTGKQIIDAASWAQAYREKTPRHGKVWMSVDASPGLHGEGRSASIAVSSYRGDDHIDSEIVAHGPGTAWVAERIGKLTREQKVQLVMVDLSGPIGTILPDIKLKCMANIEEVDARTMANACGRYHQDVLDDVAHHRSQDMLNAAVEGAAKRDLEDGWAWKRRTSTTDISPLVAVTLSHWAAAINRDRGPITMHIAESA